MTNDFDVARLLDVLHFDAAGLERYLADQLECAAAMLGASPSAGGFENGPPIDAVHFGICLHWLDRCELQGSWNTHITSYGLKHIVERDASWYVTNGAFILAAFAWGVAMQRVPGTPNARFKLSIPVAEQQRAEGGRQPISRALRFRILQRDGFRCRYCGRGAPEVELEIDHVHPASKGGTSDEGNLVTACFDCNRGKGARILPLRVPPGVAAAIHPATTDPWRSR